MGLKLFSERNKIKKVLPIHLRDISQNQNGSSRDKRNEYNSSIPVSS